MQIPLTGLSYLSVFPVLWRSICSGRQESRALQSKQNALSDCGQGNFCVLTFFAAPRSDARGIIPTRCSRSQGIDSFDTPRPRRRKLSFVSEISTAAKISTKPAATRSVSRS